MAAHTQPLPDRDRILPWVGLLAFLIMAITLIAQSGLPPFPASTPAWAFIVILAALLTALGSFTLYFYDVLSRDVREGTAETDRVSISNAGPAPAP